MSCTPDNHPAEPWAMLALNETFAGSMMEDCKRITDWQMKATARSILSSGTSVVVSPALEGLNMVLLVSQELRDEIAKAAKETP